MKYLVSLLVALMAMSGGLCKAGAIEVDLGSANAFAILAGTTVTNTGPTIIHGDIGVSPGTAVTGFPFAAGGVGVVQAGNAIAAQAEFDLASAYNLAAAQTGGTSLTGQNLGGLTLTQGVYVFTSSAQLTGNLILDAQGDPNAVFLFQIGSTLTTASNAGVTVINGGSANNVFFLVGSSATLGTGTNFEGNILALTSITLTTGASIDCGRALAVNGAVTMDSNTVSACTASATGGGTTVPEPGSITLMLMGLTGLSAVRLTRRRPPL